MVFKRKKINVLVTGAKGQLGSFIYNTMLNDSMFKDSIIGNVIGIDIENADLTDYESVSYVLGNSSYSRPLIDIDYVIHCAAATDTTGIELHPEKYYRSNVVATRNLANACVRNKIKMIHISTDYVLSEHSHLNEIGGNVSCIDEQPTNIYGLHKLLAEKEVQIAYAKSPNSYAIVRSSWLYGNSNKSFIEKFLSNVFKRCASLVSSNSNEALNIPMDCSSYGMPTHVKNIYYRIIRLINSKLDPKNKTRIFLGQPLCLNDYQISRYRFAVEILSSFKMHLEKRPNVDEVIIHTDSKNFTYRDLLAMLNDQIKLVEYESDKLDLPLDHPKKIGKIAFEAYANQSSIDYFDHSWEVYLNEYISCNIDRLVEMAAEHIRKPIKDYSSDVSMLTVGKLMNYLDKQPKTAKVLAYEQNSNAYIEQCPDLPGMFISNVKEHKAKTKEFYENVYKDSEDKDEKIASELEEQYRYAKDDDIIINT
jgi:dTDP-4-dehydrorhamnose reductase